MAAALSELRTYQSALIERVRDAFAHGSRAVVMHAPTGAGKTFMAGQILRTAVSRGHRAIFCARLTVIVEDTYDELRAQGLRVGVIQASRPRDPDAPVQIASLDTLVARGEVPDASLVILDECHCVAAPDVQTVMGRFRGAWLLGLTATPCRSDDEPLNPPFTHLVPGPQVRELIAAGSLVSVDVLSMRGTLEGQIANPLDAYREHTPQGRAIVFCKSTDAAKQLASAAEIRGIPTMAITASSKREDRRRARELLAAGPCIVTSVDVFREGWNAPYADTAILARAFPNVGPYLQAIGRVMRPAPGKRRATVLDLHASWQDCGLPDEDRSWHLEGASSRRTEKIEAVRNCHACGAIYRDAFKCPRCGAAPTARTRRIERSLNAAERMERINALPAQERDAELWNATKRQTFAWAGSRGKQAALAIARNRFRKLYGREAPA